MDRSYLTPLQARNSKALRSLLSDCVLIDAFDDENLRARDEKEVTVFYQRHHTYYYTLAGGSIPAAGLISGTSVVNKLT